MFKNPNNLYSAVMFVIGLAAGAFLLSPAAFVGSTTSPSVGPTPPSTVTLDEIHDTLEETSPLELEAHPARIHVKLV